MRNITKKGDKTMSGPLEEILSRENMRLAYKKVKANKGASGIDRITIEEVEVYLKENWEISEIKSERESTSQSR